MIRVAVRLLVSVALTPVALYAQEALYTQYRVQSFTTADGLPSNFVTDLAETRDGYLWITAGGMLARFDGHEFRIQPLGKTPSLARRVHVLLAGLGDTLWVMDQALSVLALVHGRVTAVLPPAAAGTITYLDQGSDGALYSIGAEHAWRLRAGSTREPPVSVASPAGALRDVLRGVPHWRDANGTAWFSNPVFGSVSFVDDPAARGGHGLKPQLVASPSSRTLYEVRQRGVLREVLGKDGAVLAAYPERAGTTPRLLDRSGRLWLSTRQGIEVYERGNPKPVRVLPMSGHRLIETRDGCVWSTGSNGVQRACRIAFQPFVRGWPTADAVRALFKGPGESMLVLDEAWTLYSASPAGVRVAAPRPLRRPSAGQLHTAMTDRRGTLWWTTGDTIHGQLGSTGELLIPHARSASVIEEQPGQDGVLWYAGPTHIFRVEPYATGGARITDSIPHGGGMVRAMSVTRGGVVWAVLAASDLTYHVRRMDHGRVTKFSVSDGLPAAQPRSIGADDERTAWVGTYGAGLVRIRDEQVRTVTERDGLADNVVTGVLEDRAGNFWMAGNRGVHRVARAQLEAFLDSGAPRVHGTAYGRADGIPDPETTGAAGARDAAGRFWFATLGGVVTVDPMLAVALDTIAPIVHVLSITSDRDTITVDDPAMSRDAPVQLSLDARRLNIAFTGLALRSPEGIRFEYRVDGVDDHWLYAGRARTATYSGMKPGTYTFRVRATSTGGIASREEATLRFMVPAHFHETAAFLFALLAGTGALVWIGFEGRLRHLKRREATFKRQVAERTADLSTALQTVAQQAAALQALDEAKSRFFANVSHEFRTPLTLILGPAEDVMGGRAGAITPPVRRRLGTIVSNARRLVQLVEQLLDVTRLESGQMQLRAEVQDLVPLLRRMADSFASLAAQREIAFRLSCPVAGVMMSFDADQMEKILSNLVGNALKFTPPGGRVELRLRIEDSNGGDAVLEVEDSGPGIAAQHQEHVFDRFYQVDDSSRRAHDGVGIGLALTKELVELHGGTIALHSRLAEGCTFTARFPLAAMPHVETAPLAPDPSRQVMRSPSTPMSAVVGRRASPRSSAVLKDGAVKDGATSDSGAPPKSRDELTVLVVEDNAELLEYLRDHLSHRFRVLSAPNGVRGLEIARECVPDLIVSDVMMPLMDGQTLCETIKNDPETDFIPVILLTAKASRESRLSGLTGGADDYLTKPVDLAELTIRADNLIASRRLVRERFEALRQPLPAMIPPFRRAPRDSSTDALLQRFHDALSQHLSDPDIQADGLAKAMGMSRTTLYRSLRDHLGASPMDALWDFRLAQAAQWLESTSITVSEIAYGVGFRSVPHFCTRFRERYAETPSGYRQKRLSTPASPS